MDSRTVQPNDNVRIQNFFNAYRGGAIGIHKLAELLEVPLEEAKHQLQTRNITLDLGVQDRAELLSDIENA